MDLNKEELEKIINENQAKGETILVITTRPILDTTEDGVNINDGFDFVVNGAIPQLADAIAKLALELPKNGFGENSDNGFIMYITEFYHRLKEQQK